METVTIGIDGMSCQHCVMRVRKALETLPGVSSIDVTVGSASVTFDSTKIQREELEGAVTAAGYTVRK